jgi:hypothetical protein
MGKDLQTLLRRAVESAGSQQESVLQFEFDTSQGVVEFLADVSLAGDTIFCANVCIYAQSDPPGIRKASISKDLLIVFRKLLGCAQNLGFAAARLQGTRVAGSSSAKAGKVVDITRRGKS